MFPPPISRQVYCIAAGNFHTPHQGGLISPQISTRNCIYLDTYSEVGGVLLDHMYFKLFFGAGSCQLWLKRPFWCSACCLPSRDLDEHSLKVRFLAVLHTRWFTFTIWCLRLFALHWLSLLVTAASLGGWPLSSGSSAASSCTPMQERGCSY